MPCSRDALNRKDTKHMLCTQPHYHSRGFLNKCNHTLFESNLNFNQDQMKLMITHMKIIINFLISDQRLIKAKNLNTIARLQAIRTFTSSLTPQKGSVVVQSISEFMAMLLLGS